MATEQKIITLDNLKEYTVTLYNKFDSRYVRPDVAAQFSENVTFRKDIDVYAKVLFGHSYLKEDAIYFTDTEGGFNILHAFDGDYLCPYISSDFHIVGSLISNSIEQELYNGITFISIDPITSEEYTQQISFAGPDRTVALKSDILEQTYSYAETLEILNSALMPEGTTVSNNNVTLPEGSTVSDHNVNL